MSEKYARIGRKIVCETASEFSITALSTEWCGMRFMNHVTVESYLLHEPIIQWKYFRTVTVSGMLDRTYHFDLCSHFLSSVENHPFPIGYIFTTLSIQFKSWKW